MQELTIPGRHFTPPCHARHVCFHQRQRPLPRRRSHQKAFKPQLRKSAPSAPRQQRSNEETPSLALPVARSLNFELAQSPRWWSHHVLMNLTGDGWIKPRDTRDRRGFSWYFFLGTFWYYIFGIYMYFVSICIYTYKTAATGPFISLHAG